MKNSPARDAYMSVTLVVNHNDPTSNHARVYTSVESLKLNSHLTTDYYSGKAALADLALRLGKQPEARHYEDGYSFYELRGFLN